MSELVGRRLPDLREDRLHSDRRAGDYWKKLNAAGEPLVSDDPSNLTGTVWFIVGPRDDVPATISRHTVREHDDGTISVRPNDGSSNSIAIHGPSEYWHGFIEHGVWLEG